MLSAKRMSDIIRSKRKKFDDPTEADVTVDQYGLPKNPTDIINAKMYGQVEDTINSPTKINAIEAVDPPGEDSQSIPDLKKKMARLKAVFDRLK